MARPFPNTFDKDSPMSPQSGGNTPISYQTNVNRQKTKKWADAKPVDYGGGWGDDDDDEYDPPPPPVSKTTGLRQQGQALPSQGASPVVDNTKKNYGDLPPIPGANNSRSRANSFDADDEKRNFSSTAAQQQSTTATAGPATRFSQITGVPTVRNPSGPPALSISTQQPTQAPATGLRKTSQVVSPISGSPHPEILQVGRVNTGESASIVTPSSDTRTPGSNYQTRRDFSPTAAPAPLATRVSPVSQSATDSPASRFPARKSSLSQSNDPPFADVTRAPQEAAAPKPWVAGGSSSPGPTTESVSTPIAKPLPFIRPADIYRRAEEERRQSQESGRPSMDSIVGARSSDRSESPARPQVRERLSSESLGGRRRASLEGDDTPSSGRHLMPILEPVKERKSEYGFEGFSINDHAPQSRPAITNALQEPGMSEGARLDVENSRRQSTSPKLPDLHRLSGFGEGMFSQPKPDNPPPVPTQVKEIIPPSFADATLSSSQIDEAQLPRQPSMGFRSVVNQAFDREDDSSVPPTPASQTGSVVKRTDSESTGTTGISPIMSRVPSTSIPDSRNRDLSTASILEVVSEQSTSPADSEGAGATVEKAEGRSEVIAEPVVPGFKPGHRRDISTPSPGNSPARTPDIAKVESFQHGQQAMLSDRSHEDYQDPSLNEPLQPPRPIAEREQSFRPDLPGGWTSYTSTARADTPQPESTQGPSESIQTATNLASPERAQNEEDDYDLTPTTTKRSLPQSAFGATTSAAFRAGAARGRHDQNSPLTSPVTESPGIGPSNSALPTSDPAMAPSGNLHSTATLDPRLLPTLEKAPRETQLRPDVVDGGISSDFSVAPTPPPKDTPKLSTGHGYFPNSTLPTQNKVVEESERRDGPESPVKLQIIPTLSTESSSPDEENDRLRREIESSLSPKPSDSPGNRTSFLSAQPERMASTGQDRESTYLPTEYGDYWASTSDEKEYSPSVTNQVEKEPEQSHPQPETTPIQPLNVRKSPEPSAELAPPSLQHRFSWEQSSENLAPAQAAAAHTPDTSLKETVLESQIRSPQEPAGATVDHGPILAEPIVSAGPEVPAQTLDGEKSLGSEIATHAQDSSEHHLGRDAAIIAGGAGGATAAAVTSKSTEGQPQRRLSLAEEKDPRFSSYPVSPTPPEDEHPARSSQPYFNQSSDQPSHPSAPSTVSPINSPVIPQVSPTSRILAFREIAAMKSPHQRIQTFDETRQRFAAMESGLADWMATLKAQHPEHSNATGSYAGLGGVPGGSARSKFAKANAPGAQPLQQPYYQQYLNASSPTNPSTPVSKPGPNLPAASQQQGFSPAGGSKLTSQQVQAKGKEFLHTAGIFGGKAGKAGKGLLAKGKNKLRGAGSGDKESPPPKPKADRRSSWGLPLTMSRSSGRPDASTRSSKEAPSFQLPEYLRASTMTSNQSVSTPLHPPAPTGESFDSMRGALPPINTQVQQPNELTVTTREVLDTDPSTIESESKDTLGVPAPITKEQPSWDPFNATPIAEEPASQHESRPNQHSFPFPQRSTAPPRTLLVPAEAVGVAKSDRSNSEDAHFYDAPEEQSDIKNDWVMVTPEDEQTTPKMQQEAMKTADVPSTPKPGYIKTTDTPSNREPETFKTVDVPFNREPEVFSGPDMTSNREPEAVKTADAPLQGEPEVIKTPNVPSKPESEGIMTQDGPSQSMMHRPRGSSYDTHLNSKPQPTVGPSTITAAEVVPPIEPEPTRHQQTEPEEQSSGSSFLPPIRRTSTFGFKYNSRHAKPRFPIDDPDDEDLSSSKVSEPQSISVASSVPERHEATTATAVGTASLVNVMNHDGPKAAEQVVPPQQYHETPYQQKPTSSLPIEQHREAHYQQKPTSLPIEQRREAPYQRNNATPPVEQPSREFPSQPQAPTIQPISTRPGLGHANSSEYSQRTTASRRESELVFSAPRAADMAHVPDNFRRSQDAWRPNVVTPPSHKSPTKWAEPNPSVPRQSWEPQRQGGLSGSSQSFTQRPEGPYIDRSQWIGPIQSKTFEQPPSSAQRYPELFRSEPPVMDAYAKETGDLPAHYYQAPITREAAFLPRQQTSEYQLPGVGPPEEESRSASSKRNSGFFKEIGGRFSRATSRERGISRSRDGELASPTRAFDSRNEYAESSVTSEDMQEQNKRRSSFFRGMNRASTSALQPPQSRESTIAHHAGSRTDLLLSPQPSPIGPHDKKRSFFGSNSTEPKTKPNKLSRSSTSGMTDESGKKKRFSGLSGFFGKSNPAAKGIIERPQATREVSYHERQPIESPQFDQQTPSRYRPPPHNARQPMPQNMTPQQSSRNVLTKLTANTGSSQHSSPDSKARRESKSRPRRPSGAGLLNGLMGRRSTQQDRGSEDSRSQGSSQPQAGPQYLPPAQTYTDLQQQQQQQPQQPIATPRQPQMVPFQDPSMQVQERGRRISREPQYDSVPIPGGYSLVRGQGAMAVPTEYNPRGLSRVQFNQAAEPSSLGIHSPHSVNYVHQSGQPQQYEYNTQQQQIHRVQQPGQPVNVRQSSQPKPPVLSALETYQTYQSRNSSHRLSREDILARSPARSPEGQQRPYQLSLPEDDEDRDHPVGNNRSPPISPSVGVRSPLSNVTPANSQSQHGAIQRLQKPVLRHPESPAGYPLPDDSVFSPVNPSVQDIPPPPPPKWPASQDSLHGKGQGVNQGSYLMNPNDLNRSATHRTAVSAISGMSGPHGVNENLHVPNQKEVGDGDRNISSPSPTPPTPSPANTPARTDSPARDGIKTTVMEVERRGSPGLYDASPLLPRVPRDALRAPTTTNGNSHAQISPQISPMKPSPQKADTGSNKENKKNAAELETREPDKHQARRAASAQEEKIFYDAGSGREQRGGSALSGGSRAEENEEPAMSATSYPGQEWNPYGMGAFDDGYD